MNTLSIQKIPVSDKYENTRIMIDDIPLQEYLIKWYQENGWGKIQQPIAPVNDLAVTWNGSFDHDGDARFMRFLLSKEKVNLPLLSCPEDMDFTCIVIIAEVEKTADLVYWKRIGKINHSMEIFEEEKAHGIAYVEAYTDEDWLIYNDPDLYDVDSDKWREWISANWSEELYRRRINYTYPLYQDERNIDWIYECSWCFDRKKYDALIASCNPHWFLDDVN